MQSNCRLKWKRETLYIPWPLQFSPIHSAAQEERAAGRVRPSSLVTCVQSWHRSCSPAGPTGTAARAGQTQALHSPGPFQQHPGVIWEAQPELQPQQDFGTREIKCKAALKQISSQLKFRVKWWDSPSLHETCGFISSSSKDRDDSPSPWVPKMHWKETTWNILTSLLLYFSWKVKKQCNLGK